VAQENSRKDIYQTITDQIVDMLEQGVKPWSQSWEGANLALPLRHNGEGYRGINILSLWASATMRGYTKPHWMTFKQAQALGGCVRKGEKGTSVVYANSVSVADDNAGGDDARKSVAFLKLYTVFNACQIDGIDASYPEHEKGPENPDARAAWLDCWFGGLGIDIRHGGPSAHYMPSLDSVQMPDFEQFHSSDDYYATLAHECIHASGHKARLDRDTLYKSDIPNRAREELCAELGSAFVCGALGIKLNDREDHAAYLASWLRALKDDKRAIFHAASAAQRAADFLFAVAGDDNPEAASD
jgi:antirestriction protein ArdC